MMDKKLELMINLLLEKYKFNPSAECGVSLYLKEDQDIDEHIKYGVYKNPRYPKPCWAYEYIIIYSINEQKIISVTDKHSGRSLSMIELIDKLRSANSN